MNKTIAIFLALSMLAAVNALEASKWKQAERLDEAAEILEEIMNIPEDSIPRDLFKKSECVVIIPSMKKAALGIGGNYGKGCISCRIGDRWSPPVMLQMTGGSWGLQLGGSSTDIILLIMNKKGISKLLESKFTVGVDASAAAGPKGRSAAAATDVQMRAEILSYARSRGLFAGVSINGSVLKPNKDDNSDLYGRRVDPEDLLKGGGKVPSAAHRLVTLLMLYSEEEAIDPPQTKKESSDSEDDAEEQEEEEIEE